MELFQELSHSTTLHIHTTQWEQRQSPADERLAECGDVGEDVGEDAGLQQLR